MLLIHAGICDSGMWDPQWESFPPGHQTVRCDLRGFGRTPIPPGAFSNAADVVELLERLGLGPASLVGVSLGGRVALEIAAARPDLVDRLVVSGAPLPGYEWSEAVRAFGAAEDEALERGDLDAAVEANLRMWVDGPERRADEVDPALRERVGEMQRRAFELQLPVIETADEEALAGDLAGALSRDEGSHPGARRRPRCARHARHRGPARGPDPGCPGRRDRRRGACAEPRAASGVRPPGARVPGALGRTSRPPRPNLIGRWPPSTSSPCTASRAPTRRTRRCWPTSR